MTFDGAARSAAHLLREGWAEREAARAYLQEHYGIERQLNAYAEVIENAEVASPLVYRHPVLGSTTRYRLAPWCYISAERGIYHDYEAAYLHDAALLRLLDVYPDGFSMNEAASHLDSAEVARLYRRGYLVPVT
ncbi:hypothetical protein HC928_19330 [bacterium]|nr:hypothetical protein [bacterium]